MSAMFSTLWVLLYALSFANSYPQQSNVRGNSRFVCPKTNTCSCDQVIHDYEIQCPDMFDPKITVRVQPNQHVQIDCTHLDEKNYDLIPKMTVGDVPLVQLRRCPLPRTRSLSTVLENLGATKIRTFISQSYGTSLGNSLQRHHLQGFKDLERLVLSSNELFELPADLFNDLKNLTWLDLKSQNIQFPLDIFAPLENLEFLELIYNNLQQIEPNLLKNQKKLKHLYLSGNKLKNLTKDSFEGVGNVQDLDLSSNEMETLASDVFEHLGNLTGINLSTNRYFSLPEGLFKMNKKLSLFKLNENRVPMITLPAGLLANLTVLDNVLFKCDLVTIPEDIFEGSFGIKTLTLAGNMIKELPKDLLRDQTSLVELDLSNNKLSHLDDDLLQNLRSLNSLRLSNNYLTEINNVIFQGLTTLKDIHLDHNRIHFLHQQAFVGCRALQRIYLENNELTFNDAMDIHGTKIYMSHPFQTLSELEILVLRNNSIVSILDDYTLTSLKELDMSYNNISILSANNLDFSSRKIFVNLAHNMISEVDFNFIDFMDSRGKTVDVMLEHNPINCECNLLHFIRFLKGVSMDKSDAIKIDIGDLRCAGPENMKGKLVSEVALLDLVCPLDHFDTKIKKCPSECTCMIRIEDRVLIVNCSGKGLHKIPNLPRLTDHNLTSTELYIENNNLTKLFNASLPGFADVNKIFAANNHIEQLISSNLPKHLVELDVSNNRLTHINDSVFARFNKTKPIMSFSKNRWSCDCSTVKFLGFVQSNYKLVKDYKTMECNGKHFKDMRPNDICDMIDYFWIWLGICIALLGLIIGIVIGLYYKYQQEIKVWLYAHNMCLWFVTEDELDRDKKYDAFISYSHKDEEFITDHLVPELETGSHPYKLCLHIRDWIVGEWIPNQIAKSVNDSRRTIVVLSRNFLESDWGREEFRTAHSDALKEGRARVIVVIYGEIGDVENLDPALKSYLKTNTYVKWGDPWFWNKLKYAMPHSGYKFEKTKKGLMKTGIKSSVDDKLELIKPVSMTPPLTTPPAEMAHHNPLIAKLNSSDINQNGKFNGLNGHINGAFVINTNAKQSDV